MTVDTSIGSCLIRTGLLLCRTGSFANCKIRKWLEDVVLVHLYVESGVVHQVERSGNPGLKLVVNDTETC